MLRPFLSCLLVVATASPAWCQFNKKPETPATEATGPKLDKAVTNRYQVGMRIRAIGGPVNGLSGTFAIPAEWEDQQVRKLEEKVSPHVRQFNLRSGDSGLKQIVFQIPQLPAEETATILFTFEVVTNATQVPTDTAGLVIPKNPPREVRKHLLASPQIEIANPKIRAFTKELTDGKETAWEQVAAIYEGVREKVKLENDKLKGAALTLRDGHGAEEDVAAVFVACCRAHKVPARTMFVPDSCHAEFYLEDAVGKGFWFPCVIEGDKAFGYRPEATIILQRGDNVRVPELKDPQRFVAEHLTGKGGTGGRPEVEFVRRVEH
ncbi:Transglutaminase-like superfamily protein [Anatilimnocola aggregata]|uniref:Transglutaminase-like superfamily protein n=1 Tax=Anatilimnocola aggregata TaxID=2528021 RepID=A0A517YKQ1_9BACT|nr:transglutaminase family protein [Anatilimnocola aggregata]QDU30815.1 Transglutaminase-like superfamily protein [Anatilimnocola aggregata]